MIVSFGELKALRKQVALVDGAFDPLHRGHVEYFRQARAVGRPLLCRIASDDYVRTKHEVFLPGPERAYVIDALRYVDYTHLSSTDIVSVLRELQPTHFIKGKDWEGRLPAADIEVCREYGIEIVFLDTVIGSSTGILRRYQSLLPTDH
jgi:D-beta-D-heptose 7-phosphate kinase/D-beta-D-heptose 1-phosphate adenosyltransferase